MISLDEDFLGVSDSEMVLRGLKVCGGVLAVLKTKKIVGVHYSSSASMEEILVGGNYIRNNWIKSDTIDKMYFISNHQAWKERPDKYADFKKLIDDLKVIFNHRGQIWTFDKNITALSVDIKIDSSDKIYRRPSPKSDNLKEKPDDNVKHIITPRQGVLNGKRIPIQSGSASPVVENMGIASRHKVEIDQSNWTLFSQGDLTPQ